MKLVFRFIYVSFILVKVICGEENSCNVVKTGSCVHTIHVSITSDLNTFTVYYRSPIANNVSEIAALCDWTGYLFICETKTDINYTAVSRTQVSFEPKSGVGCLDGNFTLNANGYGNFPCIEKSEKKQNSCAALKAGSCIHTIHVHITSDLRTFSLFYRTTSENKETTAICDWTGRSFLCDTKTDINYTAVSRTQVSFKPKSGVGCLDGNFTLNANGHGNFTCIEKSEKTSSEKEPFESDTDTLNLYDCEIDEAVIADDNNKRIDKRSFGTKCKQESSSVDANTENIVTGQAIGIILGIELPVLAACVVLFFLYRRRRQQNTRKFVKRPDDIETAGKSEDETRKCLSVDNDQMDSQQAVEGEN